MRPVSAIPSGFLGELIERARLCVAILMAAGIMFSIGCGGKSKSELAILEVENEVKELFNKFKTASKENDFAALFGFSSPDTIKRMIFEAIVTMGSTAKSQESEALLVRYIDEEKLKQIGQTLKNPSEDEVTQMYMMCISNPEEMFVESYKLIQRQNPDRKKPEFGELTDLKIVGNIASGKTTVKTTTVELQPVPGVGETKKVEKTQTQEITVYFIRIQGRWFYATKREWSGVGGQ